jgi:hypothetical protein
LKEVQDIILVGKFVKTHVAGIVFPYEIGDRVDEDGFAIGPTSD